MAIRDYFDLPEHVQHVEFVHQLDTQADEDRKRTTLTTYQVTESIGQRMHACLGHIEAAMNKGGSKCPFVWVHGSFGCGKSHFMDVLGLLLADEPMVYEHLPELQAHRKAFQPKVIGQNLFTLRIQCISRAIVGDSKRSLEQVIFGAAMDELARHHPDEPPPALFQVKGLFENAKAVLAGMGDEKFFAAFPSNATGDDDADWGDVDESLRWTRERFDEAVEKPASKDAKELASELARVEFFKGTATQGGYVALAEGLQILTNHLKKLGYTGFVLFLDELVLWLATLRDDKAQLAKQAAAVSLLVEAGDYPRTLPMVTFAARQRDLKTMVGDLATGEEERTFRDQLSFWKDRFAEVTLEDKELAQIIQKRLLRPKSDASQKEVEDAFERYRAKYAGDFKLLMGDQGDEDDFQRVYPLSPALVEVMVALSATLQRDRTALRELTNLLVHYVPDFELGTVVPVGDLFDVVAHGQTSDLPEVQRLYSRAKTIYESELLPLIKKKNGTNTPDRCQLERDNFDHQRGCAGCAEKQCRTQTRIAKTVLLEGLAPNTKVFQNLTAERVLKLNSGSLKKSLIPGQDTAVVSGMLSEWESVTTALSLKGENNPTIRVSLDAIDVRTILEGNKDFDNQQRRRTRIRDVLFEQLDVKTDRHGNQQRKVPWRGRTLIVGVVYENTRLAGPHTFVPGEGEDVRLLIDFPFDDEGHGPQEDEEKIRAQMQLSSAGQNTLAWLPTFLSDDMNDMLGELVTIEGLLGLKLDELARRLPSVRHDELDKARLQLEQQKASKEKRLVDALRVAYGLDPAKADDVRLASGLAPEQHVHFLREGVVLSMPQGMGFQGCFEALVQRAFDEIAPRHPVFPDRPTLNKKRLGTAVAHLERLAQTEQRRLRFTAAEADELKAMAAVEHLELVRITNDEATLVETFFQDLDKRLSASSDTLDVGRVRAALDPDNVRWLSTEVQDFLILAYAVTHRPPLRITRDGREVREIGKLANDMRLEPIELPDVETWRRARETANLLGVTSPGDARSLANVDKVAAEFTAQVQRLRSAGAEVLEEDLSSLATRLRLDKPFATTQRGETARALRELVACADAQTPLAQVKKLAALDVPKGRVTALQELASPAVIEKLRGALSHRVNLQTVDHALDVEKAGHAPAAVIDALDKLRETLRADENVRSLVPALESCALAVGKALMAPASGPAPQPIAPSAPQPTLTTGAPTPGLVAESAQDWEKIAADIRSRFEQSQKLRVRVVIESEPEE